MDTLLLRRRMMMQKVGGDITFFEKLITDGQAYIELGIRASQVACIDIELIPQIQRAEEYFFGAKELDGVWHMGGVDRSSNTIYTLWNTGERLLKQSYSNGHLIRLRYTIGDNSMSIKRYSGYYPEYTDTFNIGQLQDSIYPFFLFCMNDRGTANYYMSSGTAINHFTAYSDVSASNILIDLVPCMYRGEAGMYDTISHSYYPNKGAGRFTASN